MKRSSQKEAAWPKNAKIDPRASEIFSENVQFFQNACETYKQVLDRNVVNTFCSDEHCETVYMVEMKYNGSGWGTTAKMFYSKEEADKEAEALKVKYPFVSECRVIARRMRKSLIRGAKAD